MNARTSEKDHLADFRGAEDNKPGETERTPTPSPEDGDPPAPPAADNTDPPEGGKKPDKPAEPAQPAMSPADARRAQIGERFSKTRGAETRAFDGDLTSDKNLYGDLGKTDAERAADEAASKTPGAEGGATGEDDPPAQPEKIALKVLGDTVEKTVDEIAELSGMTADEVRAHPDTAKKFAQRELATTKKLDDAKRVLREAQSAPRAPQGGDDPASRPAPNTEPKPGKTDAPGQTDDGSDTSAIDFGKLVEEIQLEDPKKAGELLKKAVESAAKGVVQQATSEQAISARITADRNTAITAMREFAGHHADVAQNQYLTTAIATALHDEYRDDLRKAMIAEGREEDEAAEIVRNATNQQVAQAHQERRLAGDPSVRPISKAMMEAAYERVQKGLGLSGQQQQQQRPAQDLQARQDRKQNLQPQPRRASVPPATPPAQQKPLSRSGAVAEIRQARGQKTPTAR